MNASYKGIISDNEFGIAKAAEDVISLGICMVTTCIGLDERSVLPASSFGLMVLERIRMGITSQGAWYDVGIGLPVGRSSPPIVLEPCVRKSV